MSEGHRLAHARRRDREHSERQVRTTLIDALRLADSGMFNEAAAGCALALVFLRPLTRQERVERIIGDIIEQSRDTQERLPVP